MDMKRLSNRIEFAFKKWIFYICGTVMFFFSFVSCTKDEEATLSQGVIHTYKVAVFMDTQEMTRWQRTGKWALENLDKAQKNLKNKIKLELIYKNQDDSNIESYMDQVVEDTSVVAIIGPTSSILAEKMAQKIASCSKQHKPMITPAATNVEFQRKFAACDFLWNLSESDITQIEVLMSRAVKTDEHDKKIPIYLLTKDDAKSSGVSNVYADWFGFIAEEYGLDVKGVYLYKNEDDVRRYARELCGTDYKKADNVLVFNPSNPSIAAAFDQEIGIQREKLSRGKYLYTPRIFCSDTFVSDETAASMRNADYEGVDLFSNPETGFHIAYEKHFGETLTNGEAQYYDAICLLTYALEHRFITQSSLVKAINDIVDGQEKSGYSWYPEDMAIVLQKISLGECPNIDGVSSSWIFPEKSHVSVIGSTYRYWKLYNQHFITLEYISTEGSKHASSSKDMWNWTASRIDVVEADVPDYNYPELKGRWALLVAGSNSWKNYRFQADVFSMYQYLISQGYSKDHIVLIAEDDIAQNPSNPTPGTLYVKEGGVNVYDQSAIDYHLRDLNPNDIGDILQGKQSDHLPKVIKATANDNIFIFWSSHGTPGKLDFGSDLQKTISYSELKEGLQETAHRKLMMVVEACYSGGLGETCLGIPGAIFLTAANPYEPSHADMWSEKNGVYLSNSFTIGFLKSITENPRISLRDLYYKLAISTHGSHVKLYNERNYGNVYNNLMDEFFGNQPLIVGQ